MKAALVGGGLAGVGDLARASALPHEEKYDWLDATLDAYWYSLYNMNTAIAVSGVGVPFPRTDEQREMFKQRLSAILENSEVDKPVVKNPNLNQVPFTAGDPSFTQQPEAPFTGDFERINADTMAWNREAMSGVASPASVAWTHLKGVTWAKNFETHFDRLPKSEGAKFRAQVLGTMAQLSIKATLVDGGPEGNGLLTKTDENFLLASAVDPMAGEVVDPELRPLQHASMLWFLGNMVSFADGGWYGYVNPEPLIPASDLQTLADGMTKTVMEAFPPEQVYEAAGARGVGVMLGGIGWYGTHAGNEELRAQAASYANDLASIVSSLLEGNGRLAVDEPNLAAVHGAVGQGLLWASQVDSVNEKGVADRVLKYMVEELWDDDAGTFATGVDDDEYVVSARDAGDVTGGLNAADALLDLDGVQERFATYFNQTFNRARLQRAQRPPSVDPDEEFQLPLPQDAGGEFGQAAVYNSEVTYDVAADEWSVTDDRFRTAQALYLANQDVWIGNWGGSFYAGRGVPGQTDEAPTSDDGDGSTDDADDEDGKDGDVRLGATVNGWEGRAPSEIAGETNPTLTLEAGTEYVLVWENLDGVRHNFAIQTENGENVIATDLVGQEGATQTVTFTASTEMAEYFCQVHPGSMRGGLQIED